MEHLSCGDSGVLRPPVTCHSDVRCRGQENAKDEGLHRMLNDRQAALLQDEMHLLEDVLALLQKAKPARDPSCEHEFTCS